MPSYEARNALMKFISELRNKPKPVPKFKKGDWVKIKDEYYQDAELHKHLSYSSKRHLFLNLQQDIFDEKFKDCYHHAVNIGSNGRLVVLENASYLGSSSICAWYDSVQDWEMVKLLDCLLTNEIASAASAKKQQQERTIKEAQAKLKAAIKKTKCVEIDNEG